MVSDHADVGELEGLGAINFLELDDVPVGTEGEPVAQSSILRLPVRLDLPVLPEFERTPSDPFLQQVNASGHKWVILADPDGQPRVVLDADGFLRTALFQESCDPYDFCHRPVLVDDPATRLGDVIQALRVHPERPEDDVVDRDIILVWGDAPRVITGADLLGRLLRGIVRTEGRPG